MRPDDIHELIADEMAPGHEVVNVHGLDSSSGAVYQAAGITEHRTLE